MSSWLVFQCPCKPTYAIEHGNKEQLGRLRDGLEDIVRDYGVDAIFSIEDNINLYINSNLRRCKSEQEFKFKVIDGIKQRKKELELDKKAEKVRNKELVVIYRATIDSLLAFCKDEAEKKLIKACWVGYLNCTYLDYLDEDYIEFTEECNGNVDKVMEKMKEIVDDIIQQENSCWSDSKDLKEIMDAIARFEGYGLGIDDDWHRGLLD